MNTSLRRSFETFVNYSVLLQTIESVKTAVRDAHRERGVCGEALVSARVTQLYDDGACVYFYYIMDASGLAYGKRVYNEIEAVARETILECGGSISHHHGVGKHRAKYVGRGEGERSSAALIAKATKEAVDPKNTFGVRNGVFFVAEE